MIAEFLLYKIYQKMIFARDDNPVIRSYIYLFTNFVFLFFALGTFLQGLSSYLHKKHIDFLPEIGNNFMLNIIFFIVVPGLYTYFRFFHKKSVENYVRKYEKHPLNKHINNTVLFLLPLSLFLSGPLITILLFGGIILGTSYTGLLC